MTDTPSQPAPRLWPSGFSQTGAPVLKVLLILIAVVGFLIPLALVHGVITEREHRYRSVVSEIGGLWGQRSETWAAETPNGRLATVSRAHRNVMQGDQEFL